MRLIILMFLLAGGLFGQNDGMKALRQQVYKQQKARQMRQLQSTIQQFNANQNYQSWNYQNWNTYWNQQVLSTLNNLNLQLQRQQVVLPAPQPMRPIPLSNYLRLR